LRVVVTGSSGFIGEHLCSALHKAGAEVIGISRSQHPQSMMTTARVDLNDADATAAFLDKVRPETIVHLAWSIPRTTFWTSPDNLDCLAMTCSLARSAAECGVRRFVGIGTCFEYDWPNVGVCNEYVTGTRPHTLYDVCKDASRRVLDSLFHSSKTAFAWARIFFLYGPAEDSHRLVASISRDLLAGRPALCSAGDVTRDYLHVADAGAALAALALSDVVGPVNIGSGQGRRISDIVTRLAAVAERSHLLRLGALPTRLGDPERIVADIGRLQAEVGYVPTIALDDGLQSCLSYWRTFGNDV